MGMCPQHQGPGITHGTESRRGWGGGGTNDRFPLTKLGSGWGVRSEEEEEGCGGTNLTQVRGEGQGEGAGQTMTGMDGMRMNFRRYIKTDAISLLFHCQTHQMSPGF